MKLKNIIGESWYNAMSDYLSSKEFEDVGRTLQKRVTAGEKVNPVLQNVFDPFLYCPYDKLNVVFLFNDFTYNEAKQQYFWNSIEEEIYDGLNLNMEKDIYRLSKQGVLFLNKSLTEGDEELWKSFYNFVINRIKEYNSGIIFVGDFRTAISSGLFDNWSRSQNLFLPCSEPLSNNNFSEKWDTGGIFTMINSYLDQCNKIQIEW